MGAGGQQGGGRVGQGGEGRGKGKEGKEEGDQGEGAMSCKGKCTRIHFARGGKKKRWTEGGEGVKCVLLEM